MILWKGLIHLYSIHSVKLKPLIISLIISLGVGGLSGFLTRNNTNNMENLKKPALTPPSWLFPIVWTILFILMGISAYLVYMSDSNFKKPALVFYALQLAANFIWPIIFFNFSAYFLAFIWIIIIWLLILAMVKLFCNCSKTAGLLQLPYLLWVTFAGYLNYSIWILNR